jgi:hypothetical protein
MELGKAILLERGWMPTPELHPLKRRAATSALTFMTFS